MNVLFYDFNCPHCHEAKNAIILINNKLPPEESIALVYAYGEDPRTAVLAKIFGNNINEWATPLLVLDRPKVVETGNALAVQQERLVVTGVFDYKHLYFLIKRFKKGRLVEGVV